MDKQKMTSKDRVLDLLEKNRTEYISGEAIAASLGISRNAIWKAINELRKQGYVIEASSKKGYLLGNSNDIISQQGILSYLNTDEEDITEKIHVFDVIDSTNKVAKEMAISGAGHGTLVVARSQNIGRGRKNHSFYSPEGGIYMSIILSPKRLSSLEPDAITLHTGTAVCRAIEKACHVSPVIKPINDLFVNGRKICGILTESGSEFDSGLVQWIVVGIGINFDSDIAEFPHELQEIVGTIFPKGKALITKNQLIADIYKNII
ncbi:biotin--[acetyl-CoA-carboxylase] ligase [Butyrivibrio sp. YAB3001]|uniref:biotin--[acetyl-CoA-carboxylase] ligase n=1 Tax=Butyrivibrio sp. YAB3001 TaxID=1520812 RepID=UPI0008F67EBF|nr:biotin--[acetyl-CoA-carboxylase] ligase [Butyrivibrio sp. YAB3001]SFB99080.1 BirA family transcriptional regulator, biotin operon repressor / biotin-[acetyl-CoA-carboxylase] ligase [Butyrivibrio sp. YAB3001]